MELFMKRALLIAGACAILASPVFAQAPSSGPSSNMPPPITPQAAPPSPSATPQNPSLQNAPAPPPAAASSARPSQSAQSAPSTADFVKNAAISGMFEIQSSELALRKHVRPDRHFAEHMIRDHRRLAAQLKHIVRADHVDVQVPAKLDDQHRQMLDKLRHESGKAFDKDYDQMQQQGHQQAVSLFQSYSQSGGDPQLKQWAEKSLPELQDHLSMAQKLS
jgi:putative membrane protein